MAMNKRKTTTAIVAGVTALALLLGGTFAWTSISQTAKNEAAGIVNVGGRLHDDFNGTNKDVYVENFTDPLNGGQPIYARVKLTEYMEVGQDAGGTDDGDGKSEVVPVVEGTDINDVTTWTPHMPEMDCAVCETEGTCRIHDHWEWTMGGKTTFMPTFNKDKDSLAADINGTYAGTNSNDKVYYDDYVVYTTDNTADGVGVNIAEADKETYDGKIYSIIGTEIYDDDTDTAENDHASGAGVRTEEDITHTAKETAEGSVILMKDWNGQPGNFWVYDTDGWAYWANPIMPGEATGLLLDGIEMTSNPGEKCYYAINVVAQFSTVNDWENFYTDEDSKEYDVSPEAEDVLKAAAGNVATVTVSNDSGTATVKVGDTVNFSASVSLAGDAATYAAGDFKWSVLNKDLTENTTSQIVENADGTATLTIGADETSTELIVVAKATDGQYLGALGMSSVAVYFEDTNIEVTDDMNAATYAILTDDGSGNGTYAMTFIRANEEPTTDDIYNSRTITRVYSFNENEITSYPVWSGENVTSVSFANPIAPATMNGWFEGFTSLQSVDFTNLDGSKITSMQDMFDGASAIESIDMSKVIVSEDTLIDIYDAFKGCTALKELKVPNNMTVTNSGTGVIRTFSSCSSLTTITGMETWDVSNVNTFYCMFYQCGNLKNIDLSGWKFGSNASLDSMFVLCSSLEQIYGAEDWDVSKVTNMNSTFSSCNVLKLDCSSWDVGSVTTYSYFNDDAPSVTPPTWVN